MKEKMICRGDLFYYDFGAVTSVIKKRYLPSHIILGEEFGLKKPSTGIVYGLSEEL